MSIWYPHDFFFAAVWALFTFGIHRLIGWMKAQVEADKTISERDAKICRYGLLVLRGLSILTAVFSVGTIALPLLDALLTALLGTASDLFNKYGGLALIIAAAVIWWKNKHPHPAPVDNDSVEVEVAEAEADELHDDLGGLVFEAVVDASENIPLKRPRDAAAIETGRDKPFRMDGIMAIHQFNVDTSCPLSMSDREIIMTDLQRHINQRGRAYPQLCQDGYAPIIHNIKDNGNFVLVEVVLYSERYKDKIRARRKARIARQQQTGDTHDKDF